MKKTYSPRSDSLAAKVIDHLNHNAGPLTMARLIELFEGDTKSNGAKLKAAIQAGALEIVDAGGDIGFQFPASPAKKRKKSPRAAQARGVSRKRVKEPEPEAEPAEDEELAIASHSDGDITFRGAVIGDDGTVVLKPDHAEQLARYIVRQASVNMFV